MSNSYFRFKQFTIHQDKCAMKVTTDACLFGAWVADKIESGKLKVENVLDIGTGTGLLALMIAQKNRGRIECIEIDKLAVEQARDNADASPWKDRIHIKQGDVKSTTKTALEKFDVIVSNPPFYEREIRSASGNKNIAHHSEHLTLQELLEIIRNNLAANGTFYLLLPYKRNEEIKILFNDHQLQIAEIMFVRQSVTHDYFRIMLKGKINYNESEETEFNEMAITDGKQQYTHEFISLLKDYYLYL